MVFLNRAERHQANAFARIGYSNPFLPERLELERQILGERFQSGTTVIHLPSDLQGQAVFRNFDLLTEQSNILVDKMRQRVLDGKCQREEDQHLYRETVIFHLYGKHFSIHEVPWVRRANVTERPSAIGKSWSQFQKDYNWYLGLVSSDRSLDLVASSSESPRIIGSHRTISFPTILASPVQAAT